MAEPKNPFDFGTGSIDKDQWLRDIDNEQDAFISRYGNAANKHRTTLLRQAFADLRARIANGDMLNRTADGNYQFGSALNREDKHMQEAYQRALGFMGGLARRQLQAPPVAEKKAIGSLEERYIKSLNPSGKFNTEAYWKNQTDEERRTALKDFLNRELKDADNYQDFGNFGNKDTYTQRLQTVMNLLESGKANDWSLQQLGFTKNWLTQPQQQEQEEEQPKTRLEQAQENYQAAVADQQAAQIEQQLAAMNTPTPQFTSLLSFDPTQYWTYDSYIKGRDKAIEALKYTDENGNQFLKSGVTISRVPGGNGRFTEQRTTRNTAWNGQAAKDARTYAQRQYINGIGSDLSNYFKNLGVNYQSYLGNNTSKNNLMTNLSKLFTQDTEGNFVLPDIISKLFAKQEDGKYGLRGSTLSYDPTSHTLYNGTNIDTYGEGGIIKGQNGLLVDDSYYVAPSKPSKEQKTEATSDKSKQQFSTAENARIAATIADIASMGAAFVPGYGTAASAVLGLGSTATNFGADLADGQGLWGATKNAGFGLAADVMGLIPGLGGVGKGAKIARNLMWAVPKMMQWVNTYQGLQNAGEIKNSIMKLTSPSSMTVQDWQNVSQALQIMTGHGRSVATKVKKAGMSKTTTTTEPEHYIFTNKGKQKVSDETFKKLKEARGTKARQALTQELMGEGVTLQQTRFAPWNTSTRFGAFKEVPGKTKVEVQNKHKGWFSDENLVEKAENFNPSVDIRSIISKVNPYRAYYNNRVPKSSPLPEYLKRPVDILPQGFGMTKSGMEAGGFNMDKPKRKPLTEEQKATRRQKAATKKQEQKVKELENLRRQQMYGMSEEIPQASSQTINTQRKQERINLNSRFANEVEMPGPQMETQKNKFYRRYENAVRGHQIGGILRALRNGGIIKAQEGLKTNGLTNKYDNISDWTKLNFGVTEKQYFPGFMKARYDNRGNILYPHSSFAEQDEGEHFGDQSTNSAYDAQQSYYLKDNGSHIFGDVQNAYNTWKSKNNGTVQDFINYYNGEVDWLRSQGQKKLQSKANSGGWREYNQRFNNLYRNYSSYDPKLEDIIGESTWQRTPNTFKGITDFADLRQGVLGVGERATQIAIDNQGHLITDNFINPKGDIKETGKDSSKVTDSERGDKTIFNTEYKNPNDPTPYIIAGKTALGLYGNKNIYQNLLDEMPQAPLRDPIDRKLAIVGWQEAIKQGQNQLADLRNATWMQHGSDQQTNLAGMYETEGKGRDIMNGQFMKDSGRQFETAQKSWNLDNEDTSYNIGVGDANRKAIADRARMMAQIRAAWRSGDNNILMGALSDTGNWLLKKYQREQDIIDKSKELALGTPEEQAQASLQNDTEYSRIMNKHAAGQTLTDEEKAYVRRKQAEALRDIRGRFAQAYYGTYHSPWFGGGYREQILKDGGSLEKEKLRARGKDNDRYVSMIKDLRRTSYRRRRRR